MPITKQDIEKVGNTIKDTLVTWGDQIQYGRDVAKVKSIQNRVANIKSLTTNPDGTPKSREDIAKSMFNIQGDISSISNPGLMNLANTTINQYFGEALKGAMTKQDNQADLKTLEATQPRIFERYNQTGTQFEPSLADAKLDKVRQNTAKGYAPHYRTIIDPSDDTLEHDLEIMYRPDPDNPSELKSYERIVATRLRTKETPTEMYKRNIDTRKTPTTSFGHVFTPPSMQLVTDDKGIGMSYNPQTGMVWKGGQWMTPADAKVSFKVGTGQIDSPQNYQEKVQAKMDSATELIKKAFPNQVVVREGGVPVKTDEWKLVMDDLSNNNGQKYWSKLSPDIKKALQEINAK